MSVGLQYRRRPTHEATGATVHELVGLLDGHTESVGGRLGEGGEDAETTGGSDSSGESRHADPLHTALGVSVQILASRDWWKLDRAGEFDSYLDDGVL